jgi:hypothetical protein
MTDNTIGQQPPMQPPTNTDDVIARSRELNAENMRNQIKLMELKNEQDQANEGIQALKAVMDRGAKNREEMAKSLRG